MKIPKVGERKSVEGGAGVMPSTRGLYGRPKGPWKLEQELEGQVIFSGRLSGEQPRLDLRATQKMNLENCKIQCPELNKA